MDKPNLLTLPLCVDHVDSRNYFKGSGVEEISAGKSAFAYGYACPGGSIEPYYVADFYSVGSQFTVFVHYPTPPSNGRYTAFVYEWDSHYDLDSNSFVGTWKYVTGGFKPHVPLELSGTTSPEPVRIIRVIAEIEDGAGQQWPLSIEVTSYP